MRWFCGAARGFTYRVKDNSNKEVLTFERRFQCCSGCCWCADSDSCAWELEVRAGTERLGSVRQMKSLWKPYMSIILNDGDTFGEFRGPCCVCSCCGCCGDVEFPLFASDSFIIGKVSKQWTGTAREFFTDSDNFSCTFPLDMTVNGKACILAAAFLIDMMFFEQN
ncbi:hypothetical protein LSH36_131g00044 [Paralvinella palmiformis]|uniref:Phospholipid scramblase n=1 Tax=Paralvinella palmiformis TaxID=53620 RepID=A0AAD9JWR0_9ANNE|nr:hypothetical protein LSH36_131g00044 [Paralvinella palmiformis]